MKVFVMGPSRSGKTPFAERISAASGARIVKASEWVRSRFPSSDLQGQAFVDAITRFSVEELMRDPDVCVKHLRAHHDLGRCVVEGVRNPFDFAKLFDPREDVAVFLVHTRNPLAATVFESGLAAIRGLLDWLVATGLMPKERVVEYRFPEFRGATDSVVVVPAPAGSQLASLDAAIADFETRFPFRGETVEPRPARVHAELDPPLRFHARKEFFYGMDPKLVGEFVPCTAFVVSSYPGSTPSFKVLLPDGAVFSYLPASALVDPKKRKAPELPLDELVYHDCPQAEVCVHRFRALEGPVLAFFKKRDLWMSGEYLFTIDWYLGNDLLHGVALENGQVALLPHHKLKFKDATPGFQPYKKMRNAWSVGPSRPE